MSFRSIPFPVMTSDPAKPSVLSASDGDCPYRGVHPFSKEDNPYFAGRETEIQAVISKLYASKLTVLYGESGCGKTSLIRAGVLPELEKPEHRVAVVLFRDWQSHDFAVRLRKQILASLLDVINRLRGATSPLSYEELETGFRQALASEKRGCPLTEEELYETLPFHDFVTECCAVFSGQVFFILDQFEEYLYYHPDGSPGSRFDAAFARAANDPDVPASFMLSLRDDGLGKLDRLRPRMDFLLTNLYRLEHLTRIGACEAIKQPLEAYAERTGRKIAFDEQLKERLLEQVREDRIGFEDVYLPQRDAQPREESLRYRALFLQIILTRLWQHDVVGANDDVIRLRTFESLAAGKDAEETEALYIVRTYFDAMMARLSQEQQDDAAEILRFLIRTGGQKKAGTVARLARDAGIGDLSRVRNLLESMSNQEEIVPGDPRNLLRRVGSEANPMYEFVHDVMGLALRDWCDRRREDIQKRRREEDLRAADDQRRQELNAAEQKRELELAEERRKKDLEAAEQQRKLELAEERRKKDLEAAEERRQLAEQAKQLAEARERHAENNTRLEEQNRALAERARAVAEKRAAEQRRQVIWTRWVACVFLLLLVAATGALTWALFESQERRRGSQAESWSSFNQADRLIQLGQWSEGVRHLAQATKLDPQNRVVTERFFYELLINRSQARQSPISEFQPKGDVFQVVFSPDSDRLLTASSQGANLWDGRLGKAISSFGQQGTVYQVAFDAQGRRVLTVSSDKAARLWDTNSHESWSLGDAGEVVQAICSWSSDRILITTTDGTAKLFDVDSHVLVQSFEHESPGIIAAFSQDGRYILTADASPEGNDGKWIAKLRNANSGQLIMAFPHKGSILQAVFSPDCHRLLTATTDAATSVCLWNADTGALIQGFENQSPNVEVSFSPDGKGFLTVSQENYATLWDSNSGVQIHSFHHAAKVLSACFSPDNRNILTAGADNSAKSWDAKTAELIASFQHAGVVSSAVFSHDGSLVLTASADRSAKLWQSKTGKLIASFEHGEGVLTAFFSRDDQRVVTIGMNKSAKLWEVTSGELRPSFQQTESKPISTAAFSPVRHLIVTGGDDNKAVLWDEESGQRCCDFEQNARISKVAFDRDGEKFLTVSSAKARSDNATSDTVSIWDTSSRQKLNVFQSQNTIADFTPDGQSVAVTIDGSVRLFDLSSGHSKTFPCDGVIYRVAFDSDGQHILTANSKGMTQLWETNTGKLLHLFQHSDKVLDASFSHDNSLILTASADGTVRIWSARTYQAVRSLKDDSYIKKASFDRQDRRILTITGDKAVKVWDAQTGSLLHILEQQNRISDATFSPDGQRVLTAGDDNTAKVWDAESGRLVAYFRQDGPVVGAVFNLDGTRALTLSGDKAELWDLETPDKMFEEWSPNGLTSNVEQLVGMLTGTELEASRLAAGNEVEKLAEIVSGARMTNEGVVEPIDEEERRQLEAELDKIGSTGKDKVNARFLRWFMCPARDLTIFPASNQLVRSWGREVTGAGKAPPGK